MIAFSLQINPTNGQIIITDTTSPAFPTVTLKYVQITDAYGNLYINSSSGTKNYIPFTPPSTAQLIISDLYNINDTNKVNIIGTDIVLSFNLFYYNGATSLGNLIQYYLIINNINNFVMNFFANLRLSNFEVKNTALSEFNNIQTLLDGANSALLNNDLLSAQIFINRIIKLTNTISYFY